MRAVFGLLLVMLGLAMAIVWMPERDGQRQLAVVTDIAVQGLPRVAEPNPASGRTFSPHTPLLATVEPPGSRPAATIAVARAVVPTAEAPVQAGTGSSVVTGSIAQPGQPAIAVAPRGQPNGDMSRDELVRNLQRELKRVGCYAGDIDGDWGTGSKRAMLSFTDRVNASLPVEQPDFILLTLLKGQAPGVCGRTCPAGQSFADNGRCMPSAVIAQQARRRGTRDDAAGQPAPTATAGWSTQVARPATGTQREVDTATVAAGAAAAAVVAAAVAPLPGRMSVGGPSGGHASSGSSDNGSAREAVRTAQSDQSEARQARRNAARRTAVARRPAARYERPYVVYRSAPNYYASAPRASSRNWTASFFRTN